jgi:hypothetical protein
MLMPAPRLPRRASERSPMTVPVAVVLADRIEQCPSYSLRAARAENGRGWTVSTLRLSPCQSDVVIGVVLANDELREALRIARGTVKARQAP